MTHTDVMRLLDLISSRRPFGWQRFPNRRKERLAVVALVRQGCDYILPRKMHLTLDRAERYADDSNVWPDTALHQARLRMIDDARRLGRTTRLEPAAPVADLAEVLSYPFTHSGNIVGDLYRLCDNVNSLRFLQLSMPTIVHTLRDVLGDRLCTRVDYKPGEQVLSLAEAAYTQRTKERHIDTARLAILSDAMEEDGLADAAILEHLRSPGPHFKGCWALDYAAGKGVLTR